MRLAWLLASSHPGAHVDGLTPARARRQMAQECQWANPGKRYSHKLFWPMMTAAVLLISYFTLAFSPDYLLACVLVPACAPASPPARQPALRARARVDSVPTATPRCLYAQVLCFGRPLPLAVFLPGVAFVGGVPAVAVSPASGRPRPAPPRLLEIWCHCPPAPLEVACGKDHVWLFRQNKPPRSRCVCEGVCMCVCITTRWLARMMRVAGRRR